MSDTFDEKRDGDQSGASVDEGADIGTVMSTVTRPLETSDRNAAQTLLGFLRVLVKPLVFALSLLFPRDEQMWVFMTGDGSRFADSSKYLFLHCEPKDDVQNVWIGTNDETVAKLRGDGYEAYSASSFRGKYCMLRAGVFFETHGPIAPEYTGSARLVHLTHGNYLKVMLEDHIRDWSWILKHAVVLFFERRRQYVVTSDGPPAENMKSMRGAPEERMLVTGLPRNDVLLRDIPGERIGVNEKALAEFTETAADGPVFLYAPTYREAYGERNGTPFDELDLPLSKVNALLSDHDAHLFISPHPATTFNRDVNRLKNVSVLESGGDLYPFLKRCDVLITDYSGIFYDYLLLDRPIVFYAPDLEEYADDRSLYFDYDDHVPGPIANDANEFVTSIRDVLNGVDEHGDEREAVRNEFYDDPDANASERVCRAVTE